MSDDSHACADCLYHYTSELIKGREVYDAIADAVRVISVTIDGPCCGAAPGGIALDEHAPKCPNYTPRPKVKEATEDVPRRRFLRRRRR